MSKSISKKPMRIAPAELVKGVAEGVARAVEARSAAGAELSAEEVKEVSGGALSLYYYRAGGIPVDPWINSLQPGGAQTIPSALPGLVKTY